jgi:uncharacterized repeat protein (TIGR03803 family)
VGAENKTKATSSERVVEMNLLSRFSVFLVVAALAGCGRAGGSGFSPAAVHRLAVSNAGSVGLVYRFKGGKDGWNPQGALTVVNGTIFGVASEGGNAPACGQTCGTVFKLTPGAASPERGIYTFKGGKDGYGPTGSLVADKLGALYGTVGYGGDEYPGCNCGAVYKLTIKGAKVTKTTLHAFTGGNDGATPVSGVILDASGAIYGTTESGGDAACGCGTVFKLTPSGSTYKESVLYRFKGKADGQSPVGGLLLKNGVLYGAASSGGTLSANCGSGGCGTIFSLKTTGAGFRVMYRFSGADGSAPDAALIAGPNSVLYGTTLAGGNGTACAPLACGTVFSLVPSGAGFTEKVIYNFQGSAVDGAAPAASVTIDKGTLYGTTTSGGTVQSFPNWGTVFSLKHAGAAWVETGLYSFGAGGVSDGYAPESGLVAFGGGFYGTTAFGGGDSQICGSSGCGTIFKLTP